MLFIHSSLIVHLSCFQISAIRHGARMYVWSRTFFWISIICAGFSRKTAPAGPHKNEHINKGSMADTAKGSMASDATWMNTATKGLRTGQIQESQALAAGHIDERSHNNKGTCHLLIHTNQRPCPRVSLQSKPKLILP